MVIFLNRNCKNSDARVPGYWLNKPYHAHQRGDHAAIRVKTDLGNHQQLLLGTWQLKTHLLRLVSGDRIPLKVWGPLASKFRISSSCWLTWSGDSLEESTHTTPHVSELCTWGEDVTLWGCQSLIKEHGALHSCAHRWHPLNSVGYRRGKKAETWIEGEMRGVDQEELDVGSKGWILFNYIVFMF